MNKLYYTPTPDEFHPGFRYESELTPGNWGIQSIPTEFDQSWLLSNFERVFLLPKTIRVQHLHADDFSALGVSCERVPQLLGRDPLEGYICTAQINHPRKKDATVRMDIFFTPSNNWTMITFDGRCVFAGTTMNISELKRTLKRIQGDAIVTGK